MTGLNMLTCLLEQSDEGENWIEFYDKKHGHYRAALLTGKRLDSYIFIYPGNNLPPRDWLRSIDAIGEHLQAGTNCGSCKPEIMEILNS